MLEALSPYWAVVCARFRVLLEYRAAAFAGFVTQLFWGCIKVMILAAFYENARGPLPMSLSQTISYVWLGQALLGLLPWNLEAELQEKITSGAVAYELLRPVELYSLWYARSVAYRTATTALRCPLMVGFSLLVMPALGLGRWALQPPPSLASALLFLVSLTITVALAASVMMLMNAALLLTLEGRGLNTIMIGVIILFSGMVAPLPLFPDWLQPVLRYQPLRGLIDVPLRIYSGHIVPRAAATEIGMQLAWTCALVALGRRLLLRASRTLQVQGG